MTTSSALFQQQFYRDSWQNHQDVLAQRRGVSPWDYVILTASNEAQAQAYRIQIEMRLSGGYLPPQTRYCVLSDPDGVRVGSGGATLNALKRVWAESGSFEGLRVLVVHSGGDSKRVPQYSACGKLFSPFPRMLPDGRRSTLFDELIIGMAGIPSRMNGGMLVCSGDVLMIFNPLQIDVGDASAAAMSIKTGVETGKNHGVYRKDEQGNVGRFLHKQSVEMLLSQGDVDAHGRVDIDTGAIILSTDIMNALYALVTEEGAFRAFVNDRARLSFYADFLYPLASESTFEQYLREMPEEAFTDELTACRKALWQVLSRYRLKLIRLSPASFIHIGTTRELLHLMTEDLKSYNLLDWSANVLTNSRASHFAASNAFVSRRARVGTGSYIEDSYIHSGSAIGDGCLISGVTLNNQSVPGGSVLHGLKLMDGRFIARMYGVNDNPKENRLFGRELSEPLWTAPLYPPRDSMAEAVTATLEKFKHGIGDKPEPVCLSLRDSFVQADVRAILTWQEKLSDRVRVESVLEAIDSRTDLNEAIKVFRNQMSEHAKALLLQAAQDAEAGSAADLARAMRIYYALSNLTLGEEKERYMSRCFRTIRDATLLAEMQGLGDASSRAIACDEVTVRLPVRVNFGGGWSDTPPYCMENGGTVLNAAISLNGLLPVEVEVKRLSEPRVVLASADSGISREFKTTRSLQDVSNPFDPFALHKAALIVCGILPYQEDVPLPDVLKCLGGGFSLSTRVINVPRGSGLGTSSILAGASVKALCEFIGERITDDALYGRILCMEQLMSTGGGWQDQVGGLTPGIKMLRTQPGMQQRIEVSPLKLKASTLDELTRRFCLINTGQRRLARNLLREVVGRYIESQSDAVRVLYEIQRVAVLMQFELEKGNVNGFASLLDEHWALSKRLDAGCTNTCIDQIFQSIEDLIDGRMICGAGGGGFLQVILKEDVSSGQIKERLDEVFSDSGVEVWPCSFILKE